MKFENLTPEAREKLEKSFSPEILEKLKACETVNEVMNLMKDNDLTAMDDDMLEVVSGGCGIFPGQCQV